MRVVVPYTDLHPEADAALRAHARHAERVDVSGSPERYWGLLADLWAAGDDFAVVEHDVVITAGTFESFDACPEPWCGCTDPDFGVVALQCVRFRGSLISAVPDALDVPVWMRHWVQQDQSLLPRLHHAGFRCHEHHSLPTRHLTSPEQGPHHQARFYAWLAQFATWENEQLLIEMAPGLERDRLALAFLLAPLAKFVGEDALCVS